MNEYMRQPAFDDLQLSGIIRSAGPALADVNEPAWSQAGDSVALTML